MTTSAYGEIACISGVSRDCGHGIFRLEGGATRTQIKRDTNFATPGYSFFCHDTTASGKNKVFSVCGHSCGQKRFYAVFGNRGKSSKRRCRKALRRFVLPCPGYRHGTPKPRVLSTELPQDVLHILRKIQTGALPGTATHLSYQISGLLARVKWSISRHCQHRRQRSQEQCQRQQVGAAAGTEPPADEGVVQRLRQ